ncbi:hypothetical protein GCM10007171_33180 [Dickeya fangzhongdai]|nr:hypothetical protein GCM10007171_33180 [Dickeya fangzhongdai]
MSGRFKYSTCPRMLLAGGAGSCLIDLILNVLPAQVISDLRKSDYRDPEEIRREGMANNDAKNEI